MKKVFAVFLAVMMIAALAVSAMAEDVSRTQTNSRENNFFMVTRHSFLF